MRAIVFVMESMAETAPVVIRCIVSIWLRMSSVALAV